MSDPTNPPTVAIKVANDRSTATLTIARAVDDDVAEVEVADSEAPGGEAADNAAAEGDVVDVKAIERLAGEEGVQVDSEVTSRIEAAVARFQEGSDDIEEIIATATPPVDGTDGWLEWAKGCEPPAGRVVVHADEGTGRVDYYNWVSIIQLVADAHIATIHEPTAGEDGVDVSGGPLRATPGRPCDVGIDQSAVLQGDGRVLARVDGLLEHKGKLIRVAPVFQVAGSVDFSTGNIDFDGTVTVEKGICDRFRVKATENISVQGLVQAATLTCGGDLLCERGMAARDRGTIDVGGIATVGYMESVHGAIKGDLLVQRSLVHCHLAVGGDLHGGDATIVGGATSAQGTIEVDRIGSDADTITILASPAPCGQTAIHVKTQIHPRVVLLLGDCVIEFNRAVSGPVTLGRNDAGDPFCRGEGGTDSDLAYVARIVRTAA